jgi:hypothetical protein
LGVSNTKFNGGLPVGSDFQIWPFQNQIPNLFLVVGTQMSSIFTTKQGLKFGIGACKFVILSNKKSSHDSKQVLDFDLFPRL